MSLITALGTLGQAASSWVQSQSALHGEFHVIQNYKWDTVSKTRSKNQKKRHINKLLNGLKENSRQQHKWKKEVDIKKLEFNGERNIEKTVNGKFN